MPCSKRLCMRNWDTILERHKRLDKTVYGESCQSMVKVSRQHQQWFVFEFFTLLELLFQVLRIRFMKICKINPPDLLFVFFSFYISRYHFSQIFRTSFHIHNKDFHHKFSVLMDSLKPLNGQNLLSMLKFVGGGLIILATLCNDNREKRTYIPILLFQV